MTLAASCTCFFFWQPDGHSGAASNAFVCIWLIRLIGLMGLFPRFQHLQKLRLRVSTSLLCFFACRQYKGFNSRAMRFEAEFLMCENFKFENVCQKNKGKFWHWRWKEREKVLDLEGSLMLSALLWSKPAVCTGHHCQECYWVVKPHPIHIYCISIPLSININI